MKLPKQSAPVVGARSQTINAGEPMHSIAPSFFFNPQELLTCYSHCGVSKEKCDEAFKNTAHVACSIAYPNRQDVVKRMECERMSELFAEMTDTAYQAAQSRCRTTEMAR